MSAPSQEWKEQERKVAKILSEWWTGHKSLITRMPLQGRQIEVRYGDMSLHSNPAKLGVSQEQIAAATEFINGFMVDVKYRRGWNLHEFITGRGNGKVRSIVAWWTELRETAMQWNKKPMLIFTDPDVRACGYLVMMETRDIAQWEGHVGMFDKMFSTMRVGFKAGTVDQVCRIFLLQSLAEYIDATALGGCNKQED